MKVSYIILPVIFVGILSCGRKALKNDNKTEYFWEIVTFIREFDDGPLTKFAGKTF